MLPSAGSIKAYFRGNGVNVVKIAPETALRLTLNDRIKAVVAKNHLERITPMERMACGGLAGASAQVSLTHTSSSFVTQAQSHQCKACLLMIMTRLIWCQRTNTDGFPALAALHIPDVSILHSMRGIHTICLLPSLQCCTALLFAISLTVLHSTLLPTAPAP